MITHLYHESIHPSHCHMKGRGISAVAVMGTGSTAALSVYLTKMYSYRSTEALCPLSHRAHITPHCRGKANTESFTLRRAIIWQHSPVRTPASEIQFERYRATVVIGIDQWLSVRCYARSSLPLVSSLLRTVRNTNKNTCLNTQLCDAKKFCVYSSSPFSKTFLPKRYRFSDNLLMWSF